jgi:sarcosine oxidase subunit beta
MSNARTFEDRASSLPRAADCIIIGGGIVGASTALFLVRAGIRPVLLEGESDLGMRTTAMSAHCIRAQFSEPENIRMMAESLDFYERFGDQVGGVNDPSPIGLRQQGYLFASTDPADREPFLARAALQRDSGLDDVDVLDGATVRAMFPWLSDEIVVATWRERDGWIDGVVATRLMAGASRAPIHPGVTVHEIVVEHGRVAGVSTSRGEIATDTIILAAGPFCHTISPEPLPVVLKRRHRLIVGPHPAIPQHGPVTIDANTGSHWRPHNGGALMAWSQEEPDAEPLWPVPPDRAFVDLVLRGAGGVGRLSPFWRDVATSGAPHSALLTAGHYAMTPDHRPLIGPAPQTPGLWLNTGYSGHGIMGAPSGARLLADLMTGARPTVNPFAPDRFDNQTAPARTESVVL